MLMVDAVVMPMRVRRSRISSRHRMRRFKRLLFTGLPQRSFALRLLGGAVCTCTFFHLLVHVFLSHLLSPARLMGPLGHWPGRNLTWHVGPDLGEGDRRTIVVYSYQGLDSGATDMLLNSHPRVLWFDESELHRHKRLHNIALNVTTIVNQLFNCSNAALPLVLELVNREGAQLGQPSWCFPKGRTKKPSPKTSCRKVSGRQLKKFCVQHHIVVKLTNQWRLRSVLNLESPHLKVLHIIGHPKIVKNEVIQVHFSSKTQEVKRIHRNVVQPIQQKFACQRLRDDINFIRTEMPMGNGWYYQRFPPECFAFMPVSCAMELFNFLDIYASDDLVKRSRELINSSLVQHFDIGEMSDEASYARLQHIQEDVCMA